MPSTALYGPAGSALPVTLTANTTTEQMIPSANPAALASIPTSLQPSQAALLPAVLTSTIPSASALALKRFSFLISGVTAVAAAMNVTLKLYGSKAALSLTPGSNTLLGSSGAIAFAGAATTPFWAEFTGVYDPVGGLLTGVVSFFVNNTLVATVAVSTVITGITQTANPILNFGMGAIFSVANAANSLTIPEGGCSINF